MTLWLVFAVMTAAAVFAVLWPLSHREEPKRGHDLAVYRDQLDEIARDRAAGLIGVAEADAARVEVSRRLIAAADAAETDAAPGVGSATLRRRATAVAGLLLVPLGAAALYLVLGSPQLPGEPLAARIHDSQPEHSLATMISRVEAHLERHPDDARGYAVLAPVYLRLGRYDDAVAARRKLLALEGESAARDADLGEALAAAANGVVTADAKVAFDHAAKLDPKEPKAQYFLGLAAEQDGDKQKAATIWRAMLETAPADAPWAPAVRAALARVGGAPPQSTPGPTAADVAAADQMNEQDRGAMIRGMVARLADRLKQNGDDIDGWQRLMRAYMVLGERDKARAAAADAKRALGGDPAKLRHIQDVIRTMGLEG